MLLIGMLLAKHFYDTRDTYIIKDDEKWMISLDVALLFIGIFLMFNDSVGERAFKFIAPSLIYSLSYFVGYLVNKISLNIKHYKKRSPKTIRLT